MLVAARENKSQMPIALVQVVQMELKNVGTELILLLQTVIYCNFN